VHDRGREPEPEWQDDARFRPVPVRPGRGGFDPQADEQAKAYRYRRRRRIAMVLLAIAALCAVLGVLGLSLAWAGSAVAAVLLVLYLAYLRRQVRIEESIRQRRAARLERARQIRPVYRASVAEQVRVHRTGGLRRPVTDDEADEGYRVVSHARPSAASVPPAHYGPGVVVDLDDDDPAFDDLEYYRPVTYRRAAGE
jgi:membrane protein implicated in regulation of membrane protease activity